MFPEWIRTIRCFDISFYKQRRPIFVSLESPKMENILSILNFTRFKLQPHSKCFVYCFFCQLAHSLNVNTVKIKTKRSTLHTKKKQQQKTCKQKSIIHSIHINICWLASLWIPTETKSKINQTIMMPNVVFRYKLLRILLCWNAASF